MAKPMDPSHTHTQAQTRPNIFRRFFGHIGAFFGWLLGLLYRRPKAALKKALVAIKEVNAIMHQVDKGAVRWAWISAIVGGLVSLGTFALFSTIIHKATSGYLDQGQWTGKMVLIVTIGIALYFIVHAIISEIIEWRQSNFSDKLDHLLRHDHAKKMMSLDIGRMSDPDFIAIKESAESKGRPAVGNIFRMQRRLLSSIIALFASFGIMLALDGYLILLSLIPIVPQTIKAIVIERKRRKLWHDQHIIRRQAHEYASSIMGKLTAVQAKLLRRVPYMWKKYQEHSNDMRDARIAINKFDFYTDLFLRVISLSAMVLALIYLGRELMQGHLTFAKIVFLVGCMRTFTQSLSSISRTSVDFGTATRDFSYHQDFNEAKPLVEEIGAQPIKLTAPPLLIAEHITFSYPRSSKLALNDCNLVIEPNQKVAIVGRNGSGKTTFMKLLAKIYTPNSGVISVNGATLSDITQDSWLNHLLCITQDCRLSDLILAEVLTGCDPKDMDMARLVKAAEMSGAAEFISELPQGYFTQIGEDWPGGVGFSSGQKQRLKLTAAFYRLLDPEVHVALFDEPMSNCDSETKTRFYEEIHKISNKTIIVISHDPVFLHHFERVVVFEKGAIKDDLVGTEAIVAYRDEVTKKSAES